MTIRSLPRSAVLLLLSCAAPVPTVQVTDAWARATAPSQTTGVVYLSLTSAQGDVLTGVHSADSGEAMLHQATAQGGMASMAPLDSLALPAGRTVRLEPRGRHVMLMDLRHALVAGGHVRLELTFAHAGTVAADVAVLPIGAAGPPAR